MVLVSSVLAYFLTIPTTAFPCPMPQDRIKPEPKGLVVVAPQAWKPDLAPLLAMRREQRPVWFHSLESMTAPGVEGDAAERLKRRLYQQWISQSVGYVLLVGDADTLPVRYMVLDRVTEAAFHTAFYPTDLYYADLANDRGDFDSWNQEREGHHALYYGEVQGEHRKLEPINLDQISYRPEVALGRFPVSDRPALQAIVAKTLAWERKQLEAEAQSPSVLFVHPQGWIDARKPLKGLARAWTSHNWQVDLQLFDEPSLVEPSAFLAKRREKQVLFHVGHGTTESWQHCLSVKHLPLLAEGDPAVFFSVGCSTGHFSTEAPYQAYLDLHGQVHAGTNHGEVFSAPPPPPANWQPGRFNSTGLGERLIRMPAGGAVLYIGCNTGAQPCAMSLLEGFARSVVERPIQCFGEAWRLAVHDYYQKEALSQLKPTASWYPPSIFFQGMKFMLFGDPCLAIPNPRIPSTKTPNPRTPIQSPGLPTTSGD
ncbi:MAG: hypothetical protein DWQ01_09455 [Planctomycetota bacterium]|nr:MAG: hypothetical protein DWQ01_09455 [Planctomycetota bacterium]